ncbi:MAG TPA: radical SAM protein [Acidobacteriota bacterium]|nr:radical SAM protein [Acidobacteriota bacterium]
MLNEKPGVLLFNPTFNVHEHYGKLSDAASLLLPVSLLYLGGMLESKGVPVRIMDGQCDDLSEGAILRAIEEMKPIAIGITMLTPTSFDAHKLAAIVKKHYPNLWVLAGGTHPTVLPEETMEDRNIDVIAISEAEHTMMDIYEVLINGGDRSALKNIPGIWYRDGEEVVKTPDRPLFSDLDKLPLPMWHGVKMNLYHQVPDSTFARPIRVMMSSRGCPFKCIFCSARQVSGFKYRAHSADRVVEEMEILIQKYNARQIIFLDDNFIISKKRVFEICEKMMQKGYHKKVVWTAAGRADEVNEPLLKAMKDAGCVMISYGIESGSPRLLELMKKGEKKEHIEKAVAMARKAGLKTRGTLILGFPTETREESLETIDFAKKLGLHFAKFSLATPYPGTALYNIALERGLISSKDWSRFNSQAGYSTYDPVFIPEGRTAEEMKQLQRLATKEFYLRPKQIMELVTHIGGWSDIKLYLEVVKSIITVRRTQTGEAFLNH